MESFDFNVLQLICQLIIVSIVLGALVNGLFGACRASQKDPTFNYYGPVISSIVGTFLVFLIYYGAGALSIVVDLIKQIL